MSAATKTVMALALVLMACGEGEESEPPESVAMELTPGVLQGERHDVFVLIDKESGEATVERNPTLVFYEPSTTSVLVLRLPARRLLFTDDAVLAIGFGAASEDLLPRLEIVGPGGKRWWFAALEVKYELPDEVLVRLAREGGDDTTFKSVVRGVVPTFLHEEFSKFSATEMVDPKQHFAASRQVEAALGELLQPHGIQNVRVIASKAFTE